MAYVSLVEIAICPFRVERKVSTPLCDSTRLLPTSGDCLLDSQQLFGLAVSPVLVLLSYILRCPSFVISIRKQALIV